MSTWLHFIGSRVYGQKRFEREAKRIGAQRGVPFSVLERTEYGDRVFVAEYKKITDGKGKKKVDVHTATVFGYFTVDALVLNSMPPEIKQEVYKHLTVVDVVPNGFFEGRMCGGYTLGPCTIVEEDLGDLVGIIENVALAAGQGPQEYKYLIRGRYVPLESPVILRDQKFFHGYKNLDALDAPWADEIHQTKVEHGVVEVYNYSKRRYVPKAERDAVDRLLVAEGKEARGIKA